MKFLTRLLSSLVLCAGCAGAAPSKSAMTADWITPAEQSKFRTTPSYAETRAYLQRLADAAPRTLRLTRFGVSPEGRDLMLVVAAKNGEFTPEAARASGKEIMLVQAGIHAGEIEGKDAGPDAVARPHCRRQASERCSITRSWCASRSSMSMATKTRARTTASTRTGRKKWDSARRRRTSISIATT